MKLVYLSHWRFPSEKTMSPLIMRTCEELARQGFDVELWAPRRQNPAFKDSDPFLYHNTKKVFNIVWLRALDVMAQLPHTLSFPFLLISFNIAIVFQYFRTQDKSKIVFYSHDVRDIFLLSFFTNQYFVEIHDFYKSRFDYVTRRALRHAQGVVVTNEYKIKKIAESYGIPMERLLHKPNAVDIAMFDIHQSRAEARTALSLPQDKQIIVYSGHLFDWKGVDTLLAASMLLPESMLVYFVGGTDEDVESFRKKQEQVSPEKAIVVGRRSHDEIPQWLQAADTLVLPNTAKVDASKYETSPVKLFEYMASRTPIVASRLPSIQNIVDDSMVWFFEPDDAVSCASVVQESIGGQAEATQKSARAFAEVQLYSWEKRIGSVTEFINKRLQK